MKKKLLCILLSVACVISLSACGGSTEAVIDNDAKDEVIAEIEETTTEDKEQVEEAKDEATDDEETESKEANETEEATISQEYENDALAFAASLGTGWNLGNTLDAYDDGKKLADTTSTETCWGNPKTTSDMFKTLKEAGFDSVRIPVSWHNHVTIDGDNLTIDDAWIARVKEVVDMALENDLYAIINIHHDNMPNDKTYGYIPDYDHEEMTFTYVEGVWKIVADYFKDYDDRLIFESLNEPRLTNDETHEWWYEPGNAHCKEAVDIINRLNQSFVNIVRESGSNNAERYLMIPGYCASPDAINTDVFKIPEDTIENHIMIAMHAYVPYNFALNENMDFNEFNPDSSISTSDIKRIMELAQRRYIKKGIPVVLGEFGAREKNGNLESREKYYQYYVNQCYQFGIPCFVWDNGIVNGNGERFAILDRKNLSFVYPSIIDSIVNSWGE